MALKPRANAASIMACAAAPAESVCSMTGIFTFGSQWAATTTMSGARNAFSRSRCRVSSAVCGWLRRSCSASSAPKRSRAAARTVTKRHGRSRPWSGARAAAEKMSSSAPASGAGSVSARADRRVSRASMACMSTLSQTPAVLTVSEACERNKGPILTVLREELATCTRVLEVGSGTGQHAVHFAAAVLARPGVLCVYGPFRFGGQHTSESNAAFDHYLRQRDPDSGLRDFEAMDRLAQQRGLRLTADHAMPANNRTLVWRIA